MNDSRNVLRDCMGDLGKIDLQAPHAPLFFIAGEKDEIIPATLCEKNSRAYSHTTSSVAYREFKNRSHLICAEKGWEDVAASVSSWIESKRSGVARMAS